MAYCQVFIEKHSIYQGQWGPLFRKPSRDSQGCFFSFVAPPPLCPHPGSTGSYPKATHSSGSLLGDVGDEIPSWRL